MIWLALAIMGDQVEAFTPVVARNIDEWIASEDYPLRARGTEKAGVTEADVFVDSAGKPQTCTVAVSSGSEDLDVQSCAAAIRRGQFTPAADEAGRPVHGVYRFRTRWLLSDDSSKLPADITLQVARLPQGQSSLKLELAYVVDEQGRIERCAVQESSGFPVYDAAACAAMPQRYRFAPARDKAGKVWRVIRTQTVAFQTPDAAPRR